MSNAGPFKPITKNFDIDQTLLLADLAHQHPSVEAFKEVAVQQLPQATRSTRQELTNRFLSFFLETENDPSTGSGHRRIVQTPALQIWTAPQVDAQVKRQLLYVYYLRAVPLAWHAVHELVFPRAANGPTSSAGSEIPQADWDAFLSRYLIDCADSTFARTRNHLTAHLTKFGLLETEPVPGERFARRFYANSMQPQAEVYWFALGLEYADNGWTSRTVDFLAEESWSRVAFCAPAAYVRWALDEAGRAGLGYSDYYGAEKQFTWRFDDVPAAIAARLAVRSGDFSRSSPVASDQVTETETSDV